MAVDDAHSGHGALWHVSALHRREPQKTECRPGRRGTEEGMKDTESYVNIDLDSSQNR